jgi:hypothetical protein
MDGYGFHFGDFKLGSSLITKWSTLMFCSLKKQQEFESFPEQFSVYYSSSFNYNANCLLESAFSGM